MMLPTILILFIISLISGVCAFTSPVQFIGSQGINYASNYNEQSRYAQILQSTPIQQTSSQLYMVYAPPEDAEKVKSTKPKLPQPKVSFIVYL